MFGSPPRLISAPYIAPASGGVPPQAAAIIAAMSPAPNATYEAAIIAAVTNYINTGLWAKKNYIAFFAAAVQQNALIDWKNPGGSPATEVSAPTWVANKGYTGNGAGYIDTQRGWSSIAGGQDNCHLTSYLLFTGNTTTVVGNNSGGSLVTIGRSTGLLVSRLNNLASLVEGAVPVSQGVHVTLSRDNAAGYSRYIDGSAVGLSTDASTSFPANNLVVLKVNTNFASSSVSARHVSAGVALTAAEAALDRSIVQTFMTAVGANV